MFPWLSISWRIRFREQAVQGSGVRPRQAVPVGAPAGLFTADGTVANYGDKSQYVALDSCSLTLLQQVQILLLQFGIKSKILARTVGPPTLPCSRTAKGGPRHTPSSRCTPSESAGLLGSSLRPRSVSARSPKSSKAGGPEPGRYDLSGCLGGSGHLCGTHRSYGGCVRPDRAWKRTTRGQRCGGSQLPEYAYLDDTACNLASVNLGRFWDAKQGLRPRGLRARLLRDHRGAGNHGRHEPVSVREAGHQQLRAPHPGPATPTSAPCSCTWACPTTASRAAPRLRP